MNGLSILLFVCVAGAAPGTPNFLCKAHPMPSTEACTKAVETMKIAPTNATHDKDLRVFAYCAPDGGWHESKNYQPKGWK